jgi:hypothetical protein
VIYAHAIAIADIDSSGLSAMMIALKMRRVASGDLDL